MEEGLSRQKQVEGILINLHIASNLQLSCWRETDFPAVQRLSALEGWTTPQRRPEESLLAWQRSWPTLVVVKEESVIGFVRGITDGEVTTYIAELLVDPAYRGQGIGRLLLEACHLLYPHTRLDLISTEKAGDFYKHTGFRFVGEGLRKSYR